MTGEFEWSGNAHRALAVFRPREPGDGCAEDVIRRSERTLGAGLPRLLECFYRGWGERTDIMNPREDLLHPSELFVRDGHIVFCIENQGVLFWGVPIEPGAGGDPPVRFVYNEEDEHEWHPSHRSLSLFLDALVFAHGFAGGAVHGAASTKLLAEDKFPVLREHWTAVRLPCSPWGLTPAEGDEWTLYARDGEVLDPGLGRTWVTSRREGALDEVAQLLGLQWARRW